jgi:putative transposase
MLPIVKVENSLQETKEIYKEIIANPGKVFEIMRLDIKQIAERALCEILKVELTHFLGREKYERSNQEDTNYRNGSTKKKYTVKNIGELTLEVPRDRKGKYESKIVKKYEQYDKAIEKDICVLFLSGLSTRNIELVSKSILGRKISHGEVSKINKELLTGIDEWRLRDLSEYEIKYMYMDGVFFHMRVGHKIETIPMLVVIGVTKENRKIFLTLQQGDKEKASTWREVFKDLKKRGLDKDKIQLGIMDGLPGLMKVFKEEFPHSKVQRCQVHVKRNVLCKVSRGLKEEVSGKLDDIFYGGSKAKGIAAFNEFVEEYESKFPSAVKCLANVIEECLTFYDFLEDEWISIRTTNVIERVNKEFKRRTKPMEILAGESSAYRLLSFVALKMEIGWRSKPINRKIGLPNIKLFTQKS